MRLACGKCLPARVVNNACNARIVARPSVCIVAFRQLAPPRFSRADRPPRRCSRIAFYPATSPPARRPPRSGCEASAASIPKAHPFRAGRRRLPNNPNVIMHTLKSLPSRAIAFALCLAPLVTSAATYDGYGRNAKGGAGGTSVTVTTAAQLHTYAESATTYLITVSGTIDLAGTSVKVKSNKTIQGANAAATIKNGALDLGSGNVDNVVIKNLNITNPNGDGVTCWGAHNVFCTKVNFYDCGDGSFDVSQGASKVTVSWCKFSYPTQSAHRFCMILGNVDTSAAYETTLHHNWFSSRCDQRMPSGSYSTAHVYNNYFSCTGNSYCTNARVGSNWIAENNYYSSVKSPLYEEAGGKIKSSGNTFSSCTGNINLATGTGFSLPYSYTLTATSSVPSVVQAGAGNL
jgi:pectate lyase